MTNFWYQILERIHKTNEALQEEKMKLATAVKLLTALHGYFDELRNKFDYLENAAKDKAINTEYRGSIQRHIKRKRLFGEGNSEDIVLEGSLQPKKKKKTYDIIF